MAVNRMLSFEGMLRDLRYAARQLARNKIFSAIVIATISLGIGATSGVFSVVNSVLLRPLPYKNPGRLVVAYGEMRKRNASDLPFSSPDFMDLRNGAKTMFEDFGAVSTARILLQRSDGAVEQVRSASVTPNFFRLLGGKIAFGRDFVEGDSQPRAATSVTAGAGGGGQNASTVAILSYEYWQRHYAGSTAVLGQRLSNGAQGGPVIIGVLAPGFELLFPAKADVERHPDVWLATRLTYDNAERKTLEYRVIGRLKKGVTLDNAQSEVSGIAAELRQRFPIAQTSGFHIQLWPMHQYLVGGLKPSILVLMGAAILLLLIACTNVANLLLIRMSLRERELAIRIALGGKRVDLVRQVLTEAVLLAGAGTVVGSVFAWAGLHELAAFAPAGQPLLHNIGIDPRIAGFMAVAGLAAAGLFGIVPALHVSRPAVMTVLRTSGRNSLLARGRLLRNGVVIIEIALSFALLVGAGLMFRSFLRLQSIDPGFEGRHLLTFQILWPELGNSEQAGAFMDEVRDHLSTISGVQGVTAASPFPLADQFAPIRWGTEQALTDPSKFQAVDFQVVLPGYFKVMHTPLLAGRTFTDADNSPQRNLVVIDQLLAAKAFPHQSAVGRRILIRVRTPEPEWVQVIGVVAHQRDTSLAEAGREQVYFTDGFLGHGIAARWALRTASDPAQYESAVRERIAALGGQTVLTEMEPMSFFVEQSESTNRLSFLLIEVFAAIAALLAALGIYGVLSTAVRQRTGEIGVRMALGATKSRVVRLIVGQGVALGVTGMLIGCVLALPFAHWISSILVETSETDPLTFAGITVLFFLILAVASWLPARRAASVDPMLALRTE